ncbi:SigE family RNA polymerase sigma factor [Kribbella sancticallisti]|uniref:SigE family RNA polymerase sigma factor n=1 Tax=Kribbella sancticallisti TaxID=460087 RepID=A0ABN2DQX1_9ACTN
MAERDKAFVEFVAAAKPSLRRTAYLIGGDWHTADDVVQETLYKLYLAWPKVQRAGNPFAYARRMLVNVAYDGGRRPWRREVSSAVVPEYAVHSGDFAAGHAERDEVLEALRALSPRQRACIVLRYYEDLSVEQTAQILGCSESTVRSQASRGLETLRKANDRRRSPTP